MKMAYNYVSGFEKVLKKKWFAITEIQNDASLTKKQEQQKV